jgi:hypothetical protein
MEGRPQIKRALPTLSGDLGSDSAGRPAGLAFPAGVSVEGGGAEGLEPGEQFVQPPAPRIEALLPIGVRHRQLRVRTLLAGILLSQAGLLVATLVLCLAQRALVDLTRWLLDWFHPPGVPSFMLAPWT